MGIIKSTLIDGNSSASIIDKYDATRDILVLRGIEAGPGITINVADTDGINGGSSKIVISSSVEGGYDGITGSNIGTTGEGIYASKNGTDLEFKRIRAGNNVSLTSDPTGITINCNPTIVPVSGRLLGNGHSIYAGTQNNEIRFKSINVGNGLYVSETTNEIVISADIPTIPTQAISSTGYGTSLLKDSNTIKGLVGSELIKITQSDDVITISLDNQSSTSPIKFTDLIDCPSNHGTIGQVVVTTGKKLEYATLPPVAKTGQYNDLIDVPDFATVAFSGKFSDLVGRPIILSKLSQMVDVDLTGLSDGQTLIWDSTTKQWKSGIASASDIQLSGHTIIGQNTIISDTKTVLCGLEYPDHDGVDGQVLKTNGAGKLYWAQDVAGANGEINTVTNIGGGARVFKEKVGVDFKLRSLMAANNRVVVTEGDSIMIGIQEQNININSLSNVLDITKGGTGASDIITARTNLGLGSISAQNANAITVSGGTIDNVSIGSRIPGSVIAKSLTVTNNAVINGMSYPVIDGVSGQILATDGKGSLSWRDLPINHVIPTPDIVYVYPSTENGDGTMDRPFNSIKNAFTVCKSVVLLPGIYTENFVLSEGDMLTGISSATTILAGKIEISGSVTIENVSLRNTMDSAIHIKSGEVRIHNCTIERYENAETIYIENASSVSLSSCAVLGIIVNMCSTPQTVTISDTTIIGAIYSISAQANTIVSGSTIGWINHVDGHITIRGSSILKNVSNNSIESTANTGEISIIGSILTGSFAKTGTAKYTIESSSYPRNNLVGSRQYQTTISDVLAAPGVPLSSKLANLEGMIAASGIRSIQQDSSPILGGNLNVGTHQITSDTQVSLVSNEITITGALSIDTGYFSNAGDAKTTTVILRRQSVSGDFVELFVDGNSKNLSIPANCTWFVTANIVGRSISGAANKSAAFEVRACVDDHNGNRVIVGGVTKTVITRPSTWDVDMTVSNTGVHISARGDAIDTIRWVATVSIIEVRN